MPALWPIILVSSHVALADVPKLNVEPTCQAAAATKNMDRPQEACLRDEHDAEAKLKQQWKDYTLAERQRCTDMVRTGGPPSYVELLTCLQTAKAASELPKQGLEGPVK